jgi:hypothetical protein
MTEGFRTEGNSYIFYHLKPSLRYEYQLLLFDSNDTPVAMSQRLDFITEDVYIKDVSVIERFTNSVVRKTIFNPILLTKFYQHT